MSALSLDESEEAKVPLYHITKGVLRKRSVWSKSHFFAIGLALTVSVVFCAYFAFNASNYFAGPPVTSAYEVTNSTLYLVRPEGTTGLCNDGSSPTYYISRSGSPEHWLIVLEGHEFCFSNQSCEEHFASRGGSQSGGTNRDSDTLDKDENGMLSGNATHNPHFYNYTRVWVRYCSSDAWVGNAASGEDGNDLEWHFMGSQILTDVLEDMSANQGLYNATSIIMTGEATTGTQGAILNLDRIAMMSTDLFPDATITGYNDCGWYLDIPAFDTTGDCATFYNCTVQESFAYGVELWNPVLPTACLAFQDDGEGYKCWFFEYWITDMQTALYHVQNVYDWGTLEAYQVHTYDNSTVAYVDAFGQLMRDALLATAVPSFAPSCSVHGVILFTDAWYNLTIDGTSPEEAAYDFYLSHTGGVTLDTCDSFDCNPACLESGAYTSDLEEDCPDTYTCLNGVCYCA